MRAERLPIAERLESGSFPHPVAHLHCRETSISWVLLTGTFAYKVKKPVQLPFLDASTLERRQFLCQEELRLNRRYAPGLYVDVVPITEQGGHLRVAAPGEPVEYAVRMQEFEPIQELSQQLTMGRVTGAEMAEFGQSLSNWHRSAPFAPPETDYATVELIEAQMLANFEGLRTSLDSAQVGRLAHLERWTRGQLHRLSPLLQQRRSLQCIRECHGDLHAGNLVRWQDQWVPFDCLEFAPRLRWIDVVSDVAFLYMDLLYFMREELAYAFLSGYLEHGGDYEAVRLLSLYSVYRALVRAKVNAPRTAMTAGAQPIMRDVPESELQQRLQLADCLSKPTAPALILMQGVSASGKSYISTRLIGALGAVRVRSDLERRRLLGAGDYSAAATESTYERLSRCAQAALEAGQRIIVDATFLDQRHRRSFEQLARRFACPYVIVSCNAPPEILRRRLAARAQEANDPSEATFEVLEHQLARLQSLETADSANLIALDTSSDSDIDSAADRLRARLSLPARFVRPGQRESERGIDR
jgi:aminoglycoside phosphotransferase family enzyme/predicted kinase